jgi:L-seryl-tRNA(Ser) seleniumtransferase
VHTNLGRAPLAANAVTAIGSAASAYSNLELRLDTGLRGSRNEHVESLITELTDAEAALVVNNCASAVLLVLATFAKDHEVVVSRGELIEIGGSFRMPDVIAESGAIMAEVGTTNRTSFGDYERAINANTRVLLISHPSNYRVIGFTAKPSLKELVGLAHAHDCLCVHDLGSGCLVDLAGHGLAPEPTVNESIAAGIDLVLFSGDKLLGGPQAGLIAGRRELIDRLRKSPLARAARIDKLSLAGLRATLELYLPPHDPFAEIPVLRMMTTPLAEIRERTTALVEALRAQATIDAEVVECASFAGGGTLPMHEIPSLAVRLRRADVSADHLAQRLRTGEPAVITRINDNAVMLDLRTVQEDESDALAAAIVSATAD